MYMDVSAVSSFLFVPPTSSIYTLSLHDALPICEIARLVTPGSTTATRLSKSISRMRLNLPMPSSTPSESGSAPPDNEVPRSEEHTSELQSRQYLVCRLLLEKKKKRNSKTKTHAE